MIDKSLPLIYLLNTDEAMNALLKSKGFNSSAHKMNGYKEYDSSSRGGMSIPYNNEVPRNCHEAEIIIIDTSPREGFVSNTYNGRSVYYSNIPSVAYLFPLDVSYAIKNSFSTNKKQLIIFFASYYDKQNYNIEVEGSDSYQLTSDSLYLPHSYFNIVKRTGNRISINQSHDNQEIKKCLMKFLPESNYNVAFNIYTNDVVLAVNGSNEPVSIIRKIGNKTIMVFPDLAGKDSFISELFEKVLPELPEFQDLFPDNDNFSWTKDFSYISLEEKNKSIEIAEEIKRHEQTISLLNNEYEMIHNDDKNVKLRNMLKETGDDLVLSVKWFLEYIGFTNVIDPDKNVDVDAGEIFEEDLNFQYDGIHFLLEVKGIGGTSTDAQCAQISKIALRRRRSNPGNTYKAVYVVNHQRYRAPMERINIPFNETQIEDAEMTNRGMTFTYEFFNIYHMIEAGIITKSAAREAFKQEGLINFRESIYKLNFNHCYKGSTVYSLIIPEEINFTVAKSDKLAIQDKENHWHLLNIESIQVDGQDYGEVSSGKFGAKVDKLIPEARDYYVVKVNDLAI